MAIPRLLLFCGWGTVKADVAGCRLQVGAGCISKTIFGLKAQHSPQGLLGNFERSNNWQTESNASGAIGWTQRDGGNWPAWQPVERRGGSRHPEAHPSLTIFSK